MDSDLKLKVASVGKENDLGDLVPEEAFKTGDWEEATLIGPRERLVELLRTALDHAEGLADGESIEILVPKAGLAPYFVFSIQADELEPDDPVMLLYSTGSLR